MCKRIDDLEHFLDIVDNQLIDLEKQVVTAEDDLGISGNKITSLLKNVFFKRGSGQSNSRSKFGPLEIFHTEDYIDCTNNYISEEKNVSAKSNSIENLS